MIEGSTFSRGEALLTFEMLGGVRSALLRLARLLFLLPRPCLVDSQLLMKMGGLAGLSRVPILSARVRLRRLVYCARLSCGAVNSGVRIFEMLVLAGFEPAASPSRILHAYVANEQWNALRSNRFGKALAIDRSRSPPVLPACTFAMSHSWTWSVHWCGNSLSESARI